jgi:dipeptidyl aminopeptidase/acylaminoacyl peptidase
MAQAFDATRHQLSGEARPIAETARFDVQPNVSASETGVLAYSTGLTPDRQLQWVDRSGRELTKVLEPAPWGNFDLSPDGNRVVVSLARAGRFADIWSLDLTRGVQTRLTFLDVFDNSPIWSPDGRRIAFTRNEGPGQSQVIIMSASGGNETVLNAAHGPLDDWSPDGRFITFNSDPWLTAVPTDGSGKVFTFARTAAANFDESHFSPDGKWIAYNSNASGTWEVYLSHFPSTDERWQISPNGGAEVRWRSDGKELYYLGLDGQMMAVDVQLGSDVVLSPPRALFQSGIAVNPRTDEYAVSADGQRFLLSRQIVGGSRFPLTVVLNWPAVLKQ